VTGFELVAGVISIFFVAGIVMGVLIVAVLPRRQGRRYMNGGDWQELPPRNDDDERPPPSPWPGSLCLRAAAGPSARGRLGAARCHPQQSEDPLRRRMSVVQPR